MDKEVNFIIEKFLLLGKKIPSVYDLLIRGALGNNKYLIQCWSDLDFTIIVKLINTEVHRAVKKLYKDISSNSTIKISITLVDLDDVLSVNHYHGMKPLYYSFLLENSQSLLVKNTHYLKKVHIFNDGIRRDCYSNIVYLIHDLRVRYMHCDYNLTDMSIFCRHLAKRAKHIVRNAIFVKTGFVSEDIDSNMLTNSFNSIDKKFLEILIKIKANWEEIRENQDELIKIIEYLFENVEYIYQSVTKFMNNIKIGNSI